MTASTLIDQIIEALPGLAAEFLDTAAALGRFVIDSWEPFTAFLQQYGVTLQQISCALGLVTIAAALSLFRKLGRLLTGLLLAAGLLALASGTIDWSALISSFS